MPYVTSVERIGFERGMQQQKNLISKLISKKFFSLPPCKGALPF
ncbi:Uncharacterized protein dnl_18010 [Desulfonema limicola]|uniref:Uncharacterized protein n=1 Tax=Desulfonema limicola TaxID=45656 RepID=A0A975GFT9_9BACT|nr:hypothetical protein [Desulfonema limicola]QTA79529.1 Uncharacterized protein dnl_18010 [Desulfonema limicola]